MRSGWMVLVLAVWIAAGCDTGPKTGTVVGEVTLDGQPLKEGAISFSPIAGDMGTGGAVIADGKFTAEKVPATKMRVQINAPKVVGKRKVYDTPESPVVDIVQELIPLAYNAESKLELDVQAGTQTVKYELKTKP